MTTTLAKAAGRRWTVALEVKVPDLWVGAFWDRRGPLLNVWVCLLPCLPIHVQVLRPIKGEDWRACDPADVIKDGLRTHFWNAALKTYGTWAEKRRKRPATGKERRHG